MKVAAIDQGTTSTRVLVIEDGGTARVAGQIRHQTLYPQQGWVEQDAAELLANIRNLLAAAGKVDAIALANQGESCLAWDALTGTPLSPVLVWQDARTAEALSQLGPEAAVISNEICGLPLDPYFSASKLGWLLRSTPQVAQALAAGRLRLGTTDAFFLSQLTGRHVTDLTTASRTGLLSLETLGWSHELCALHGIPLEILPKIAASAEDFGSIEGTPVLASVVDQQAALVGHGCRDAGDCKITFGTGAFLLAVAGDSRPKSEHLLPTIGWTLSGPSSRQPATGSFPVFAVEGGIYDAGAALDWARRAGWFDDLAELDGFTGPSAISRGLVFVPAFSGLAAPYWDRDAAPLLIGMTPATSKADLVRALLEGIALLTSGLVEAADSVRRISIDGGLSQSRFFAQFLADSCAREVVTLGSPEMTSLGLAALAGVDVTAAQRPAARFLPGGAVQPEDRARFFQALTLAKGWRKPLPPGRAD